jgi:hypothetical protein
MNTHRPIISLVTLLALAASPAMAMTASCCCAKKPVEVVKSCCQKTSETTEAPTAAVKPCCAKRELAHQSVGARACCCVEPTPAVLTSRNDATANQTVRETTLAVAPTSIAALVPAFTPIRVEAATEPPPLSGPPLLALYCTWLK